MESLGCPAEVAASQGDLLALMCAHKAAPYLTSETTLNAARCGSLECLSFLYKHGARWHPDATNIAARFGSVECMRFILATGGPRDDRIVLTCFHAVRMSPSKKRPMDTLMLALDTRPRLPYSMEVDPQAIKIMDALFPNDSKEERERAHANIRSAKSREVTLIMEVRARLHGIRVIQRAWRLKLRRKRKAVEVIQDAYLAWTCRPGSGHTYHQARLDFAGALSVAEPSPRESLE